MRRSNIQLVVFNIAGTTVKDDGNVAEAFKYALHQFGYSIPLNEIKLVMGYKISVAISMLLEKFYPVEKENNPGHIEDIYSVFSEIMVSFYETNTALQPVNNAEYVFSQLQSHDIKVALNTGFSKKITDTILKRFGWNRTNLVDFVISSDEVENGRPSAEMIQAIMNATGITDAAFVAKVGDTEVDILEGRNAACGLVVGISTGINTRNQLISFTPDAVIDDISELPLILNSAVLAKHIA